MQVKYYSNLYNYLFFFPFWAFFKAGKRLYLVTVYFKRQRITVGKPYCEIAGYKINLGNNGVALGRFNR